MTAALWALMGGVLGAIIGSFLAALVMRWPQDETMGGRSRCDACHAQLRWFELVPLVSYVVQRGKCRHCGAAIAAQHFAIELLCLTIGAVALAIFPGWEGLAGAVFGWVLVALAALDLAHFWLPDRLTAALAIIGLIHAFAGVAPSLSDSLIGGVAGFATLALIAWGYERVRGRQGMGAGDPKLLGAIGVWVGWQSLPFVLIGASGVGLAAALVLRLRGHDVTGATRLPLGTLMAVAAFPIWIFSR